MTYEEKINTIKGIPNSAFYYLGKMAAWKNWLEADMKISPINSESGKAQVKADNFFINLYSEKFCEAMGWN